MESVNHRDLSGCNVGNHLRNEERIETRTDCVFGLCVIHYFFFESVDTADTYSEDHTDFVQVFFFHINASGCYSFFGSSNSILCIKIHFASFFPVDEIGRVEVFHFAGKLSLELGCVKMSNRSCSAYSVDQVVPEI